jgi:precorrin-4 methylase
MIRGAGSGADALSAPGKLYIVSMGTAPDLITLRALEVIEKADIFIIEDEPARAQWAASIGAREVWLAPHHLLLFYGTDPNGLEDPQHRALALENAARRRELCDRIRSAVEGGKVVAALYPGDVMIFGTLYFLELLPKDFPSEIVPGVGAFQTVSVAVKASPMYGWDTSSVILTMGDWPGRLDTNEKLMGPQTSMVFFCMRVDYPALFAQLARHYPAETPVAVVCFAGDPAREEVVRSTVGTFLAEVRYRDLPAKSHTLLVGKFLTVGQARKDGVAGGVNQFEQTHGRASNER